MNTSFIYLFMATGWTILSIDLYSDELFEGAKFAILMGTIFLVASGIIDAINRKQLTKENNDGNKA